MQTEDKTRYRIENYLNVGNLYSCDIPKLNKKCKISTQMNFTKETFEDYVNELIQKEKNEVLQKI